MEEKKQTSQTVQKSTQSQDGSQSKQSPKSQADQSSLAPIRVFEATLNKYEQTVIDLVTSKGVNPKEFMVTVLNAVKKNPVLLECDRSSLFAAILTAAELGLMPNTKFGFSYLIPYNNNKGSKANPKWVKEVDFQIGYPGNLEIMHRNPDVINVVTNLVYEGDDFDYQMGSNTYISHKPCRPSKRGKRIAAYSIVELKGGKTIQAIVWDEDIEQIKTKSKGSDSEYSPWHQNNDPMGWMWKKVAIKQVSKEVPKTKSPDLAKALEVDSIASTNRRLVLDEDTGEVFIDESDQKKLMSESSQSQKEDGVANAAKNLMK